MAVYPMDDKTVVITGANSGIGFETALSLAGSGAHLVLGCRNQEKADTAIAEIVRRTGNHDVVNHALDLASLASVQQFADSLSHLDHIDVLVNNAGVMIDQRSETADGFETVFGTNHLGPFLLTKLLLPQIRAAGRARIVNVSSMAHGAAIGGIRYGDLDRNGSFSPTRVYGESKLANALHAEELAARLEGTGITANSLHPGAVNTHFGQEGDTTGVTGALMNLQLGAVRSKVLKTPTEGAATSIYLATSPEVSNESGRFWANSKPKKTYPWTRRRGDAKFLWSVSDRMVAAAT
jgi:NAD(P)-dependent dehydrogenase (short-subunit alcohol dehydrogenase family)